MVQVPSPFVHEQFQTVSMPSRPLILAAEPSIWTWASGGTTLIVLNRISAPNRGSEAKRLLIPIPAFIAARSTGTSLYPKPSSFAPRAKLRPNLPGLQLILHNPPELAR